MNTMTPLTYPTKLAARVAGEDIQPGDFVTVLIETIEMPSYLWCGWGAPLAADEPVRIHYAPSDAGQPYRVITACLPFVYVKQPQGDIHCFDTRQVELVRLDPDSGRLAWKGWRKKLKQRRK